MSNFRQLMVILWLGAAAVTACSADEGTTVVTPSNLDRSDVTEVANAFLVSFIDSEFETVRDLVHPDQREEVDEFIELMRDVPQSDTEVLTVRPDAKVIEQTGERALVEYAGRYCLAEARVDVTTTVVGGPADDGTERDDTVGVPEQCFDIAEVFSDEPVEYRRAEQTWYAPFPT